MNFKFIDLGSAKQDKYKLGAISEQDWKLLIEDIVLNLSENKQVRSIMSTVSIRDNKAKVKLAYDDGVYHEMVIRLDEFGLEVHNYSDIVSKLLQERMIALYGQEYELDVEAAIQTKSLN